MPFYEYSIFLLLPNFQYYKPDLLNDDEFITMYVNFKLHIYLNSTYPKRGTLNAERGTRNAERGTLNAEHGTQNAEHVTINSSEYTDYISYSTIPVHIHSV